MKILAIENEIPGTPESAFSPLLRAEALRAWELYTAGMLREMYFRCDNHAAVLVLECDSADKAREALASLPLVSNGLITFDVIPLSPYTGFARLFHPEAE